MNRVKFSVILLTMVILIPLMGFNVYKSDAPAVSATADKKSYSPGESGVLTISFKTTSKVKIPKEPEVAVNITSDNIEGQGVQDYSGGDG